MSTHTRYHAFDALRATMMVLGIVIHSAMCYSSSEDMTWPLRAKETSKVFYFLVECIHSFRMPVFFFMAGFFGALLFYQKGFSAMLINRVKRILLPFLVFVVLLRPFQTWAFRYCAAAFDGEEPAGLAHQLAMPSSYIPFQLSHLWFLYYLFLISLVAFLLAKFSRNMPVSRIDAFVARLFKHSWLRLLALTCMSFLLLLFSGAPSFETSVSWIPDLGILSYFLAFYLAGWWLYRHHDMVSGLAQGYVLPGLLGLLAFLYKMYGAYHQNLILLQLLNSFITCSLSFGIIGIFLHFAHKPNRVSIYISQAAYWIYLVHFFVALWLTGFINDLPISVYFKFLIVLSGNAVLCLLSYHLLVRRTFIAVFLNGKKAG